MPIHIDEPTPGVLFDPGNFRIRGWLWLPEEQADFAAVEAHDGDILLGEISSATFQARADVNAKYGLAAGTRTAFEFSARHPTARPREPFALTIRARRHDGSHTPPLFSRLLAAPPPERHPFQYLCNRVPADALGLEIGAHTNPVTGLSPFYTDAVASYAGSAGRVDFLADARALPLPDGTLDYLCSSHVLEHLPDPIAALHEWHRVLRPGGWLYLVVPDKRFTFDEPRATTSCEHLLRDFREGTTAADAAVHIDEFIYQTSWSMLSPNTAPAEIPQQQAAARARYLEDLAQGRPIDIHYHTFTPDSLDMVLRAAGFLDGERARFTRLAHAERYPPGRDDGIGLLLEKSGDATMARHAIRTFALEAATPATPALPLACPIDLSPLRLETLPGGQRVLIATSSGRSYPCSNERPNLLPPAHPPARRPWNDRERRVAHSTAEFPSVTFPTATTIRSHLDEPVPGTRIDPLCFFVRGWLWLDSTQPFIAAVEAWVGDVLVGETTALYERPDVCVAHWLPPGTRTGYELFAHHPSAPAGKPIAVEVRARLADGTRTPVVFTTTLATIGRDYRTNHFGVLLDRQTTAIQRHGNVFAVGPSQAEGSGELAHLIRRYVGPAPRRLIDVGCGFGSYGRGLLADGYDWMGAEVNAADCAELARLGLPHRHVDGRTLPFADAAFDAALCLEVLEHIEDPRAFLAEVRRVAPHQLIVSVPNCELLGYLWDHLATPWHMLEATHTNFFTRWSLGALLRDFYPHVEVRFHTPYPLRTVEGTPLHYNLLAVATSPRR
ncbi:methyltransferase domain-containing protein [Horticoccus sp. 23ND18S-11]|uniref:methyltransferase domain-containing protein n=1 Tax=Horticoccus sp. 23ND18S-11 TaxID=3391832 RepID=UPI0039C9E30E